MESNYMNQGEKTFFTPGDVCTIKQNIPNKPTMVVVKIERSLIKSENSNPYLRGVKCRWFTTNGQLQEAVFSTKDLIKL